MDQDGVRIVPMSANVKTALVLASIAAVFFFGVIVKYLVLE